ncbi:MAG: WD40 repeat domain-containing protein [Armatimonadaceae bacterium]
MHTSMALVVSLLIITGAIAAAPPVKSKKTGPVSKPKQAALSALRPSTLEAPDWSVAFHPDGNRIAIGTYRKVVVYALADGEKVAEWPVGTEAIRALAFHASGKVLAIGSGAPGASGSVVLLDTTTGQATQTLKIHDDTIEGLAFSGDVLLSASDDEKVVLTDTKTGTRIGVLSEHIGRCLSVAVPVRTTDGAGGAIFATGGADKMVKIWDANLRRVVVNFDQAQSAVWSLTALPQPGRFVAGCDDGTVRIFQVRADRPGVRDGQEDAPVGPDGRKPEFMAPTLKPGQPAPRTGSQTQVLTGHSAAVYTVAASSNGSFIASGGADHKVIVWDRNGGKVRELSDAKGDVWSVAISGNSRWLAASSVDGYTRIYDLTDGTLTSTFPKSRTPAGAAGNKKP